MPPPGSRLAASAWSDVDPIEERRRQVQAEWELGRSLRGRNRLGQFATPPELALDIARFAAQLWSGRGPVRFLEPALGSGAFFGALRQAFSEEPVERALGIEQDSDLAHAARGLWGHAGLRVSRGDFARLVPPQPHERFNLILTNPPYVRHHHLDVASKKRLREQAARLGWSVNGLSGLYVYFVLLADRWLEEGGLACWLLPSEFLDVNYGEVLRRYLADEVSLLRLHRFDAKDRQFGDALVTSAVVVYEKRRPACRRERVVLSEGGSLERPRDQARVERGRLVGADRGSRWLAAGVSRRTEGVDRAPDGGMPIGELFEIRRGIATGANRFFVLPREQAAARGIPEEALRPILPGPRKLLEDVVEAGPDGYPLGLEPLSVIDCALEEEEIRDRWPGLFGYLQEGRARGVHRGYLARRRRPWYAQEGREPAPFVCTYMGRATAERGQRPFRFVWNRSRAIVANVYLMLYPREPLRSALAADPGLAARVHTAFRRIEASSFVRHGRVYGGGLYKVEPRELASVPVEGLSQGFGAPASPELGRR